MAEWLAHSYNTCVCGTICCCCCCCCCCCINRINNRTNICGYVERQSWVRHRLLLLLQHPGQQPRQHMISLNWYKCVRYQPMLLHQPHRNSDTPSCPPLCTPSPSRPDITSRSGTYMSLYVAMLAQCITAQRVTPFYRIDCDTRSFQVAPAQHVVGSKPTSLSTPAVRS